MTQQQQAINTIASYHIILRYIQLSLFVTSWIMVGFISLTRYYFEAEYHISK